MKRIAAASASANDKMTSSSRDRLVPAGLNVYDSFWDMSPGSDDNDDSDDVKGEGEGHLIYMKASKTVHGLCL